MAYAMTLRNRRWSFATLRELLAKATSRRSGDELAGVAATSAVERVAAQTVLADVPLSQFLVELVVPYELDEVTRLIIDSHNATAFASVADLTVGQFREWLLDYSTTAEVLAGLAPGLTPEMVAAVSKICRNQDLILIAKKAKVVTRFRNTVGLPRAPKRSPAAESSDGRFQCHRRQHSGRAALRQRRRVYRHQPGDGFR